VRLRVNHRAPQLSGGGRIWRDCCINLFMSRLIAPALVALWPAAAQAASGGIAEPSNLALVALGVVGLIVGRAGASRRRPRDGE